MQHPIKARVMTGLIIATAAVPIHATCETARLISTVLPNGTYSYLYTPGIEAGPGSSTVSVSVEGLFWALGSGDPALEQGLDNGSFVGLEQGDDNWIQRPLGYPATFRTTWAESRQIDGCIGLDTCTSVLLSDQANGRGYFALLTAPAVGGDYSFVQSDNGPIVLAPIPVPGISDVATFPSIVRGTARVDPPENGLFVDAQCPAEVLSGYRIYARVVPHGAVAPSDLRRSEGQWELVNGGQAPSGEALALGTSADVSVSCSSNTDVYFASALVFDSGFETLHVSEPLSAIGCD